MTSTGSETAFPRGNVTVGAVLNVPSLPTHDSRYVIGRDRPDVRVTVYVRAYGSPTVTPSRS